MLSWLNSYETGVTSVDCDHRRLFWCLNELERAVQQRRAPAVLEKLLELFERYARAHFAHEEEHLRGADGPVALARADAHKAFLERVVQGRKRIAVNDGSAFAVSSVHAELCEWTTRHVADGANARSMMAQAG